MPMLASEKIIEFEKPGKEVNITYWGVTSGHRATSLQVYRKSGSLDFVRLPWRNAMRKCKIFTQSISSFNMITLEHIDKQKHG